MVDLAREKKVFLMEAIWSRFTPAYAKLKELVNDPSSGGIGDVRYVHSTFGEDATGVARMVKKELGGGTMLDLGIYCLHLITWIFGIEQRADSVNVSGHLFKVRQKV